MRTTSALLFGVASQSLTHRVIEGRPTSATFAVYEDYADDVAASVEFSGTATIDAVDTTVDAASGQAQAEPTRINLTSTASIATKQKYLISENSVREWVEPIEIVSGSHIFVRHPLRNDYTTAATFVGTTISAAVDDTWAATESSISDHLDPNPDYRVRWEIVVGGVTYVHYSYFDLVRATSGHGVDFEDLNARTPGLHDSLPIEYMRDQCRPVIDAAYRSVQARLASMKINVDAIRDAQFIDELVIMRTMLTLAMGGWHPAGMSPAEYIALTQVEYDRFVEQHVQVELKHPVALGQSTAAQPVRAEPFWSK